MDTDSLKYGVFSFIIPGLGHAGAILIHIFIWFFMNNALGSIAQTLYHLYAGFDAFKKY